MPETAAPISPEDAKFSAREIVQPTQEDFTKFAEVNEVNSTEPTLKKVTVPELDTPVLLEDDDFNANPSKPKKATEKTPNPIEVRNQAEATEQGYYDSLGIEVDDDHFIAQRYEQKRKQRAEVQEKRDAKARADAAREILRSDPQVDVATLDDDDFDTVNGLGTVAKKKAEEAKKLATEQAKKDAELDAAEEYYLNDILKVEDTKAPEAEKLVPLFNKGDLIKVKRSNGDIDDGWTVEDTFIDKDGKRRVHVKKTITDDAGEQHMMKDAYESDLIEANKATGAKERLSELKAKLTKKVGALALKRSALTTEATDADPSDDSDNKGLVAKLKANYSENKDQDLYGFKRQAFENQLRMHSVSGKTLKGEKVDMHIPLASEARTAKALGSKEAFDKFLDATKENALKNEFPGYEEKIKQIIDERLDIKTRFNALRESIAKRNGVLDRGEKATQDELKQLRNEAAELHQKEDALRREIASYEK